MRTFFIVALVLATGCNRTESNATVGATASASSTPVQDKTRSSSSTPVQDKPPSVAPRVEGATGSTETKPQGSEWVGAWTGSQAEKGGGTSGITPALEYRVSVDANGKDVRISVEGTQTVRHYIARAEETPTGLNLRFTAYGADDVHYEEKLAPATVLGTLTKDPSGKVVLNCRELPTVDDKKRAVTMTKSSKANTR